MLAPMRSSQLTSESVLQVLLQPRRCAELGRRANGSLLLQERIMNKDQVAGTAKDVAGKVQRKVGEATGSTEQQIKGAARQAEGKVQKGVGDATEALRKADKGKI